MDWRRKLDRFGAMTWPERGLVLEAAWFLGLSSLALMLIPFRRLAPWLERGARAGTKVNPSDYRRIGRAVAIAAGNVPWNAVCLPQAMAAKLMLARRGFASTLHLGVAKGSDGVLIAHAWLDAGGVTVVGGEAKAGFSPIGRLG
jgi:hypothetical protein